LSRRWSSRGLGSAANFENGAAQGHGVMQEDFKFRAAAIPRSPASCTVEECKITRLVCLVSGNPIYSAAAEYRSSCSVIHDATSSHTSTLRKRATRSVATRRSQRSASGRCNCWARWKRTRAAQYSSGVVVASTAIRRSRANQWVNQRSNNFVLAAREA
jgi:hypothetical protein